MRKSFKYRLYPNNEQVQRLEQTLETCRHLYNDALAWRKEAYELEGRSVGYYEQSAGLPAYKIDNPYLPQVNAQVLQDVLRLVDKSFKAFFRRVKAREKPGYPRFKSLGRYDSFTYPQSGFAIVGRKLSLAKVGEVNIKLHRPIEGAVKTCSIRRDVDRWFAIFTVEVPDTPKVVPRTAVGVDAGLQSLVALSTGETIRPPKFLRRSEERLALEQRHLSRKKKGSTNRHKQRLRVARVHRKVRNQRLNTNHKLARRLVDGYDLIAFEDLRIINMLHNHHLAKSIADASWGMLRALTASKAEGAGKTVVLVDPWGTSQECSRCGAVVGKDLSERVHSCPACGLTIDRDANAAINILQRTGWEPPVVPVEIGPLPSIVAGQAPSMKQEATGLVRW